MNVRVVIFDWDGTLVDSVEHIADSLHQAATDLGYPELEREAYRDIIGLGMVEALEKLYPGISREEMNSIRDGYARYFFSKVTTPQNVFEGMADVVADLRGAGRSCSVATGKSRRGLDSALVSSGLGDHFEITRCADETRSKPDPAMLEEILRFYRIEPEEAVMIGDTRYDLEMAQRIGMPSIGVEWGVHKRDVLGDYSPRAIVDSVPDLRRVLGL
ncbi:MULTISPECIES: HAD family hydrolase [Marinobacter]|jgi:phosphoglycolate phosphatase|uniref:HAD family hydrolase n=1 Tax=Marinobacter TaxID=2742 RepID=UPI0007D931BC|nr:MULTISPECIES: HAD-IA family hydrolase [Marinobacter]MBL3824392.1 HAD-IA family hydrolase [Marinobacter sp. MC3]MBL3892898.1 HAD-IA family hydrolase [Marinobacter sp. MW3]MCD1648216.1 HAD-IA family hydrolase [Marinobacter adhaerens]OAN90339.1 HAD family hydrolase [Marinobacter sp. EhN04]OAN96941.1 HAD family hydrolase [Marinobacter sp. EhC06]